MSAMLTSLLSRLAPVALMAVPYALYDWHPHGLVQQSISIGCFMMAALLSAILWRLDIKRQRRARQDEPST